MSSYRRFDEWCASIFRVNQSNTYGGLPYNFHNIHLTEDWTQEIPTGSSETSNQPDCNTSHPTASSSCFPLVYLQWHKTRCFRLWYVSHGPPCITAGSIIQRWAGWSMTYLVEKSMYCLALETAVVAAPTTSVFLTPQRGPTEGLHVKLIRCEATDNFSECSLRKYRAYTKEWCGFNSDSHLNRTIVLCMPCTLQY